MTYTTTQEREGYCASDEWVPAWDAEECSKYSGYGAYWVPAGEEHVPATRRERTNAWERIKGAITGEP